MSQLNNGHAEQVAQLITELREQKATVEQHIHAAELLLASLQGDELDGLVNARTSGTAGKPAYKLPIRDAILAYARAQADGIYRVKDAADAFVANGMYSKKGVAAAGMYWHLKSDNRFTKISRGTFRFKEVR